MQVITSPKESTGFSDATEREADRFAHAAVGRGALLNLVEPGMPHTVPLLAQLAAAIRPGQEGGDGGSAGKDSGAPLDLAASELLYEIRQETAERLALLTGEATPVGPLADQLRRLVKLAGQDEDSGLRTLKAVTRRLAVWVQRIGEVFDPVVVQPIQGACPECEAERASVEGMAGKMAIKPALERRGTNAGCYCCGHVWEGIEGMRTLAAQLAGSTVAALEAEKAELERLEANAAAEAELRAA